MRVYDSPRTRMGVRFLAPQNCLRDKNAAHSWFHSERELRVRLDQDTWQGIGSTRQAYSLQRYYQLVVNRSLELAYIGSTLCEKLGQER